MIGYLPINSKSGSLHGMLFPQWDSETTVKAIRMIIEDLFRSEI